MANTVLDALAGERVLKANPLGAVTDHWIVVRPAGSQAEIVFALSRVSTVKTIKTSYPGLLVVASAALVIAAAAASSKQGAGAALPIALVGVMFAIGYLLSHKASVSFKVDGERIQTPEGAVRDASELMSAIEKAVARLDHAEED